MTVFFRPLARLLPVLGLAACAAQPMADPAQPMAWGGTWVVTDAFPAGPVADMGAAPLGQRLRMDAAQAGDVAGRLCPGPVYRDGKGLLSARLGASVKDMPGETATLDVECAGQPFAAYALLPDGTLMTRSGPWLLRLEHGEKLASRPAPMMPEPPMALAAPSPPPAPATPPPEPAPAAKAAPAHLVYLASYRTEAWAKKGWGILSAQAPSLKGLEPVTRAVDLKGKGTFIRLFAPAADAAAGKTICKELGKAIAECGAAGRDK